MVPAVLSGLLWWRGNNDRHSLLELLSVYGYSIGIFIPITVGSEGGNGWRIPSLVPMLHGLGTRLGNPMMGFSSLPQMLWVIDSDMLRWALLAVGAALSG